ncbi:hypothetical protein J1C56_21105 [Aminobacter anthyllidis]|uniref:Uncharacterized protein n=1 Tax=Aminobacter anthyllidis TaxID=1035067 RepID=A0A9X1D7G0_9HYPH|nr:hypothetical protein [Aminobacter anthyllidis]MBT1158101.1 hypothetical protein [Aminobacter anthyllidis]
MKKLLAAAGLAVLATPAFAADPTQPVEETVRQVSGYGQIYGGGLWLSELTDDTLWAAGGAVRINVPFAERWNAQGDFTVDAIGVDGESLHGVGGAAHVFWRDPASYAFGGFAQLNTFGSSSSSDIDIWDWKVGPEAQAYFGNVTVYAQAYYGGFEADFLPYDVDLMGIRGVVRYFAQDNLRFDGELGFHRTNLSVGSLEANFDTIAAALQATYRFDGTPWSVFGRYQYENTSISEGPDSESFDSHKLMVGLRASFGSTTLIDEDRNGATMDTYQPNFVMPFPFL